MNKAFRLMLCLWMFAGLSICAGLRVEAQSKGATMINVERLIRSANFDAAKLPELPEFPPTVVRGFTAMPLPLFEHDFLQPPFALMSDPGLLLQGAILKRLGIRYRFTGSDDHGYDCSGFVWRVFREAGADFERVATRTLWQQLPEARSQETRQFGTLVFFNGLKHIGIVRDANTFYHSSRSQGVTISQFTGYWEKRITGFRRSPMPILPSPPEFPSAVE